MYLHLYYNPEKSADDGKAFNRRLDKLKEEWLSGRRNPAHEKSYRKGSLSGRSPEKAERLISKTQRQALTRYTGYFFCQRNLVMCSGHSG